MNISLKFLPTLSEKKGLKSKTIEERLMLEKRLRDDVAAIENAINTGVL